MEWVDSDFEQYHFSQTYNEESLKKEMCAVNVEGRESNRENN